MDPTLRFQCQHCYTPLEVPLALAGVTGPCPACGNAITAPQLAAVAPENFAYAQSAAAPSYEGDGYQPAQHAQAQPGQDLGYAHGQGHGYGYGYGYSQGQPPTETRVPQYEMHLPRTALELPAASGQGQDYFAPQQLGYAQLPSYADSYEDSGQGTLAPTMPDVLNSFEDHYGPAAGDASNYAYPDEAPIAEATAPVDPRPKQIHRFGPSVSDHGPNLPKILGWGTVSLTAVAAAATLGMMLFTKPRVQKIIDTPGAGMGDQILAKTDQVERKKEEAAIQAVDLVRQFLARGATGVDTKLLTDITGKTPAFNHPLFPSLDAAQLTAQKVQREIGSDDFWTELAGPNGFPVFLIEQDATGSRIHARAMQEQTQGTLRLFLTDFAAEPYVGYFRTKPLDGKHPLESLHSMPAMSLVNAFPDPTLVPLGAAAVAVPHSPVAKRIEERLSTASWTDYESAVLELRWERTAAGQPYLSIATIIPCGWSRL